MAASMEDGELTDSEDEPEKTLPNRDNKGQPDGAPAVFDPSQYRMRKVPGLSSSEDSDSEDEPHEKRVSTQTKTAVFGAFKNPLLHSSHRGPADLGFGDASSQQKGHMSKKNKKAPPSYCDLDCPQSLSASSQKKKPNLWGSVLTEQEISREMVYFGVEGNDLKNNWRDVESYDYKKVALMKADSSDEDSNEGGKTQMEIKMEDNEDDDDKEAKGQESLFEMETFGKIDEKPLKLTVKDRLGKRKDSDDSSESDSVESYAFKRFQHKKIEPVDFTEELKRYKLKRKRVDEKQKRKDVRGTFRDKCGKDKRRPCSNIPSGYIKVTEEDSKEKIVMALTENLQEPKVDLMGRVFDVLGARKSLGLMAETLSIEESGGLMINNGSRRRTPGGVFLFLLRNDKHITKSDLDEIFKEEQAIEKKKQKERRKILKAQRSESRQRTWRRPQDICGGSGPGGPGDDRKHLLTVVRKEGDGKSAEDEEEGEIKDENDGAKQEACLDDEDDELDLELDPDMDVQLE